MDNNFFAYLEQLELIAFFSGYPLVYAFAIVFAGKQPNKSNFKDRIPSLLPFAYALVGTSYLGLQVRDLYPDYSMENIKLFFQAPYLRIFGLLAILFWIPSVAKKKVLSLLHSLVFFFLFFKGIFVELLPESSTNGSIIKNQTKVYTDSLLLNLGALGIIMILFFLIERNRKRQLHP